MRVSVHMCGSMTAASPRGAPTAARTAMPFARLAKTQARGLSTPAATSCVVALGSTHEASLSSTTPSPRRARRAAHPAMSPATARTTRMVAASLASRRTVSGGAKLVLLRLHQALGTSHQLLPHHLLQVRLCMFSLATIDRLLVW